VGSLLQGVWKKIPAGTKKMLISNLCLTAFAKHLVKLVKQVLHSALRKQTKRPVKRQRPHSLLHFCLLPQQKSSEAPSLFIENICLTGYIGGQTSTSSGIPIHTSAGVLPLAMQAILVTLIELFLNYKP
jgi:hypothetical protein